MKRVLAFALIFLLAMGGALAEAGAGWRLDAHSLVVTVGEERFAPDLSYQLEALAEGRALYAESAVRPETTSCFRCRRCSTAMN